MSPKPSCSCPDHHGEGPSVWELPLPLGLRQEWRTLVTRRRFLGQMGKVFGWASLATLLGEKARAEATGPVGPNFAPKAKRGIYLFMHGGPPQIDLWDYKPGLAQLFDRDLPESVRGGQRLTGMTEGQTRFPIAPAFWKFRQHGQCGRWISDLLPWTSKLADDLAVIHTLNTDAINHEPAGDLLATGNMVAGKPSLGAWLSYGLGSMNENLPTFVVLTSRKIPEATQQPIYPYLWGSGFLSNKYSGVAFRSEGDPVLYLSDPRGINHELRRAMIETVNRLNQRTYEELGDPETQARISQYEMAFHMQTSIPDLTDMRNEPASTWDLYGPDARIQGSFAYNCLLARRLAERGVRFTQIYQRGWDVHENVPKMLPKLCAATDRPIYGLITDLKRRGLLEDTAVIWAGEFGRTVYSQGGLTADDYGRDHHPRCFTVWMAGGGVRPGVAHGITDDYSYNIVRDPVHVRDFNATILHLFGIDHDRLTFKAQGLEQKLTGTVPAHVVRDVVL